MNDIYLFFVLVIFRAYNKELAAAPLALKGWLETRNIPVDSVGGKTTSVLNNK
jgi:hypothetical protein